MIEMNEHHERTGANKTDAGNGSKAICRVSNVLRSPSPDPRRSAKNAPSIEPRTMLHQIIQQTEGRTPTEGSRAWRYGFLAFVALLFIWQLALEIQSPRAEFLKTLRSLAIPIMLALNHLAFSFNFRPTVQRAVRIGAVAWMIFGGWLVWQSSHSP